MRYRSETPWSPLAAMFAVGTIIVVAVAAGLAASSLGSLGGHLRAVVALLVMQVVTILLIVLAAGAWRGRPRIVLALGPVPVVRAFAAAFAGLLALVLPYNAVVWLVAPDILLADLAPFREQIASPAAPLLFVAVAIGAPVSEELVFRGFLQSALAPSRLGFWGAALVTTILWTALHAGYSLVGLAEVALVGLYLALLLAWSGSLWLPLVVHATYNAILFALMAALP